MCSLSSHLGAFCSIPCLSFSPPGGGGSRAKKASSFYVDPGLIPRCEFQERDKPELPLLLALFEGLVLARRRGHDGVRNEAINNSINTCFNGWRSSYHPILRSIRTSLFYECVCARVIFVWEQKNLNQREGKSSSNILEGTQTEKSPPALAFPQNQPTDTMNPQFYARR